MEQCKVCGGYNTTPSSETLLVFGKTTRIYRCNSCDLLFTLPLPSKSELSQYYGSGQAQAESGFDLEDLIEKHEFYVSKPPGSYLALRDFFLGNCGDLDKDQNCLEVGCNLGVFIELCQQKSLAKFYGLEFNIDAVDFVRARQSFEISDLSIEQEPFPGIMFSCIFLFDVLEHVPDPVEFVQCLKNRLSDNGFIIVAVPNARAFPSRIIRFFKKLKGKDIFPTVNPPFHLYGYSLKNLILLFESMGFTKKAHKNYAMDYFNIYDKDLVTEHRQRNINLIIGNLLSKIGTITKDDKIVICFQKK